MKAVKWAVVALLIVAVGVAVAAQLSPTSSPQTIDFTLTDIYGERFSLSDFRGKVVVIEFMGIWCKGCEIQLQHLKWLYTRIDPERVVLVMISVGPSDTEDVLRKYVEQMGIEWRVMMDRAGLAEKLDIVYLPTTIIVDQNGVVHDRFDGVVSGKTLHQVINWLLKR